MTARWKSQGWENLTQTERDLEGEIRQYTCTPYALVCVLYRTLEPTPRALVIWPGLPAPRHKFYPDIDTAKVAVELRGHKGD